MTLSYFRQYEAQRLAFLPGSIWVEKDGQDCVVKKIELLNENDLVLTDVYNYVSWGSSYHRQSKLVYCKILHSAFSELSNFDLRTNRIVSWRRDYLTLYYRKLE